MKCKDSFVIDYPEQFENHHKHGDLILLSDTNFNPEWKKILYGDVLENPLNIKHKQLQKGDRIYFHYLISEDEYMHEGKLLVPVDAVFCYVRDGKIYPYGEYVLGKPAYPENTTEIEVDGKKIQTIIGKSGLVEKVDIQHDKRLTKIVYSQDEFEIKAGDMAIMTHASDQFYKIEGEDMFPIPYEELLGTVH